MNADIETTDDIRRVVDAFYRNIEQDALLGRYFTGLDMAAHLPRMYAFWSAVVFGNGGFDGNPFAKHAAMPDLDVLHFERWLSRFEATVDAHFSGAQAVRMKGQAGFIARAFQRRLGLIAPI